MKLAPLRSKEFQEELNKHNYPLKVSKKDTVEQAETEKAKIILLNKQPAFFYINERLIPHLKLLQKHLDLLPKIVVDMGAIKFLISGADVMRPGIVSIDEGIKKDDFILVVDQNNQKPIAVGVALFDFSEMKSMEKGKVIKNIHYVGDGIWGFTEK